MIVLKNSTHRKNSEHGKALFKHTKHQRGWEKKQQQQTPVAMSSSDWGMLANKLNLSMCWSQAELDHWVTNCAYVHTFFSVSRCVS